MHSDSAIGAVAAAELEISTLRLFDICWIKGGQVSEALVTSIVKVIELSKRGNGLQRQWPTPNSWKTQQIFLELGN